MFKHEPFSRGKKKILNWGRWQTGSVVLCSVCCVCWAKIVSLKWRVDFAPALDFPPFFCIIMINQNECLESFFFDKFIILRKIQSFASPFPKIRKWHSCFFYQNCNILIPKLIKKQHLSTFLTRSHYRMGNNKPSHFKTHYLIPVLIVVVTQIKNTGALPALHRCKAQYWLVHLIGHPADRVSRPTTCHTRAEDSIKGTPLSLVYFLLFAVRKKMEKTQESTPVVNWAREFMLAYQNSRHHRDTWRYMDENRMIEWDAMSEILNRNTENDEPDPLWEEIRSGKNKYSEFFPPKHPATRDCKCLTCDAVFGGPGLPKDQGGA